MNYADAHAMIKRIIENEGFGYSFVTGNHPHYSSQCARVNDKGIGVQIRMRVVAQGREYESVERIRLSWDKASYQRTTRTFPELKAGGFNEKGITKALQELMAQIKDYHAMIKRLAERKDERHAALQAIADKLKGYVDIKQSTWELFVGTADTKIGPISVHIIDPTHITLCLPDCKTVEQVIDILERLK